MGDHPRLPQRAEAKTDHWLFVFCAVYMMLMLYILNVQPEAHHHAATQSPTFLSHIRAHSPGEGCDFETVCNYCKKSVVFVQTDICE